MNTTAETLQTPSPADSHEPVAANAAATGKRPANADVLDAIADAITALSGIADALAYRTAAYPDDMLELLANAAETQASELRELGLLED